MHDDDNRLIILKEEPQLAVCAVYTALTLLQLLFADLLLQSGRWWRRLVAHKMIEYIKLFLNWIHNLLSVIGPVTLFLNFYAQQYSIVMHSAYCALVCHVTCFSTIMNNDLKLFSNDHQRCSYNVISTLLMTEYCSYDDYGTDGGCYDNRARNHDNCFWNYFLR